MQQCKTNELIVVRAISRGGSTAVGKWLLAQHKEFTPDNDDFLDIQTIPDKKYVPYVLDRYCKGRDLKRLVVIYEKGPYFNSYTMDILKGYIKYNSLKEVINLRDARNWLCSALVSHWPNKEQGRAMIHSWNELAIESLGDTHHTKSRHIFFDKWFVDKEYRMNKCYEIGIDFTDLNLDRVHSQSGFQKTETDARNLDVLHRWLDIPHQHELSYLKYFEQLRYNNNRLLEKENWNND